MQKSTTCNKLCNCNCKLDMYVNWLATNKHWLAYLSRRLNQHLKSRFRRSVRKRNEEKEGGVEEEQAESQKKEWDEEDRDAEKGH